MTAPNLLPCPFCGGADAGYTSNGVESCSVLCESCGCEGPPAPTAGAAVVAWNSRVGTTAQAGQMDTISVQRKLLEHVASESRLVRNLAISRVRALLGKENT